MLDNKCQLVLQLIQRNDKWIEDKTIDLIGFNIDKCWI